ncbi:MAG: hypothetical protein EPN25_14765 [Nitrospirae bacterium]|nr:MAG: hypothetical protein EPN25_14765 [Nitrospirota bacterium]
MKELLGKLIKLQEIDSHILSKRRFIDKVPYRILEKDLPLKQAQAELEKMQQKNEALNRKKRDQEKRVEEISEKIKKMKARTDLKTNKEYQAHLKEIEASEKEISDIEEAILLMMDDFEALSKVQKEKEAKVALERANLDAMKKELDQEVVLYERELSRKKEERAVLVGSLDPADYKFYMRLLENCNGTAVVGARDEVCSGCNMNIPPQLYAEIRKNEELITCPQCSRILYISDE